MKLIPHDSFLQYQCLYCNSFCARSVVPIRCVPHPRNWAWMCRRSSKDFFQPMCWSIKCRISEKGCWNCLWFRKRLGVSPDFSVFLFHFFTMTVSTSQKVPFPLFIGIFSQLFVDCSYGSFNLLHTHKMGWIEAFWSFRCRTSIKRLRCWKRLAAEMKNQEPTQHETLVYHKSDTLQTGWKVDLRRDLEEICRPLERSSELP